MLAFQNPTALEHELERITTQLTLPAWGYVVLLFGLFVIPRILQRNRIPRAITCFGLGLVTALVVTSLTPFETHDMAIELMGTLGIVSLFLFAGLEVDTRVIRDHGRVFATYFAVGLAGLCLMALLVGTIFDVSTPTAALIALAVLTPSAGFILESLDSHAGSAKEKFWIRTTVISTEIVALAVMFVTLQSHDLLTFVRSGLILAAVVMGLPWLFHLFARWIAPHAPKSEFAFLIVVAISCAFMTKALGVYYLVGAFVVGMAAQRFRQRLPAMASEKMLEAVESFASLFVPFYFYKAGLSLRVSDLGLDSILVGIALVAIALPLRIAAVTAHRRYALGEDWHQGWRVGVSLLPTLVFTLVLAQILRDEPRFDAPPYLFGALIVYALISTMAPTWVLEEAPPELDAPHAPAVGYGVDTDETVAAREPAALAVLAEGLDAPATGEEPGPPPAVPRRDSESKPLV